jgi:hypothetical protein
MHLVVGLSGSIKGSRMRGSRSAERTAGVGRIRGSMVPRTTGIGAFETLVVLMENAC